MTRNELITIENAVTRAVISIDRSPLMALEHAREAYRMLGTMLAPHEAGITGIVVQDIAVAQPAHWLPGEELGFDGKPGIDHPANDPHAVASAILNAPLP